MKKEKNDRSSSDKLSRGAYFSTTVMSLVEGATSALMTSVLLVFLTDYAGLGEMGAKLGTALLFGARIFDAVDDSVQSWFVDRARPTRIGKYRPFMLASILLSTIGAVFRCDGRPYRRRLFFDPGNRCQRPETESLPAWTAYLSVL